MKFACFIHDVEKICHNIVAHQDASCMTNRETVQQLRGMLANAATKSLGNIFRSLSGFDRLIGSSHYISQKAEEVSVCDFKRQELCQSRRCEQTTSER